MTQDPFDTRLPSNASAESEAQEGVRLPGVEGRKEAPVEGRPTADEASATGLPKDFDLQDGLWRSVLSADPFERLLLDPSVGPISSHDVTKNTKLLLSFWNQKLVAFSQGANRDRLLHRFADGNEVRFRSYPARIQSAHDELFDDASLAAALARRDDARIAKGRGRIDGLIALAVVDGVVAPAEWDRIVEEGLRAGLYVDEVTTYALEQIARHGAVLGEEGERRPPFRFLGSEYGAPVDLAGALAGNWSEALRVWNSRRQDLLNWLRDDLGEIGLATRLEEIRRVHTGEHQQLFLVLQALASGRLPSFMGRPVTMEALRTSGVDVMGGDEAVAAWFRDLHSNDILAIAGRQTPGGQAIETTRQAWSGVLSSFQAVVQQAPGDVELTPERLSQLLAAGTPGSDALALLRERARGAATRCARSRLWFENLGSVDEADAGVLLVMIATASMAEAEVEAATEARRLRLGRLWMHVGGGAVLSSSAAFIWWFLVEGYCAGGPAVCSAGWPYPPLQMADVAYLGGGVIGALGLLGAVNARIAGRG